MEDEVCLLLRSQTRTLLVLHYAAKTSIKPATTAAHAPSHFARYLWLAPSFTAHLDLLDENYLGKEGVAKGRGARPSNSEPCEVVKDEKE